MELNMKSRLHLLRHRSGTYFSEYRALPKTLDLPLVKTRADHSLTVLTTGTVSTNVFLRRLHNFAFGDRLFLFEPSFQ